MRILELVEKFVVVVECEISVLHWSNLFSSGLSYGHGPTWTIIFRQVIMNDIMWGSMHVTMQLIMQAIIQLIMKATMHIIL